MNGTQHTPHVLIVDDDLDFARSTALILKRKGYAVSIAADGLAAIQQVQAVPFDLVLMDIRMPGLDGVETYQRLKNIQPDIAVVLMTGFAEEERVQAGLHAGVLAVLTKPLDVEQALHLIESVVTRHQALALVVDDYPESCAVLTRLLERKGYAVACAESGEQAIALVQQHRYQIIFIDIQLPTIDGLQTYLAIRALDPNVAVVMVTGYREEMNALVQTALQNNAYACLYKPFDIAQVLALVEEIEKLRNAPK